MREIKRSTAFRFLLQVNSTGKRRSCGLMSGLGYNELRMIALAPETNVLYYVAFVDRVDVRRIISVRRANRREVKHYVESF
jgi:hypothetical protein